MLNLSAFLQALVKKDLNLKPGLVVLSSEAILFSNCTVHLKFQKEAQRKIKGKYSKNTHKK